MSRHLSLPEILLRLVLLITAGVFLGQGSAHASSSEDVITVNSVGPVGSIDPIQQDALNSTIVFKNVYPRLVNLGSDADSKAFLAESWSVSADRLRWTFRLRKGLHFENGASITPAVVAANFKRVLWLTKNEKTQLHMKALGLADWKAMKDSLPGIQWDSENLYFNFSKPYDELLETLDQALFGIIPVEMFDPNNGKMLENGKIVSGGYYTIERSEKDHVVLKKSPQWKTKGPGTVIIRWDPLELDKIGSLEQKYDLIITNGMNFNEEMRQRFADAGDVYTFSVAPPVLMNFVQLNASKPIFANAELRKAVRSKFYSDFFSNPEAKRLFSLSNSFLPKGAPGFKEHEVPASSAPHSGPKQKVRLVWWPPAQLNKANDLILNSLSDALKSAGLDLQIYRCHTRAEMIEKMRSNDFDVMVRLTGVLIRNPLADLKLMFQSKMGARIPDPSGNCAKLLDATNVEENAEARRVMAEKINDQVFQDASILTYSHSGFAFVYNEKKLSIERFNTHNDPFDFTAVEFKKTAQ